MGVVHPGILDFGPLFGAYISAPCRFWCFLVQPVSAFGSCDRRSGLRYEPEKVSSLRKDVDVERALAEKYQVVSIPTVLLLFKDGKLIDKRVGQPAGKIIRNY